MNESSNAHANVTERRWVWNCTDESIAKGQVSVLALAEIPCAIAVFWWIGHNSSWPWFTWLGLLAAPILLLRSESSVQDGLRRLGAYLDAHRKELLLVRMETKVWTRTIYILAFSGIFFVTWLTSCLSAWTQLIASATMMIALTFIAVGALISIDPEYGSERPSPIAEVLFLPFFVLGLFSRTVSIRLSATMSHPLQGLAQLPHNWRETLAVIDVCHLPELLPGAGTLDRKLTMKGLLDTSFSRPSILVGYKLALGFVMYLPAMLYRWNLKASAWLWWPLALILSAPFGGKSEVAKWDAIAVTTQGYWASKREWAVFLVGAWLVTTFISPAHIKELGFLKNLDEAIKVSSWLPPPSPTTLRYWLLWLWVTLQFWLHKRAVDYRAIGAKPGEDLKAADATRRVASLVVIGRIAQSVTATYVLIVWTLGLWFAQEHWPHLFRSSVWGWLRPWL